MIILVMRFSDKFAPAEGTIAVHKAIIEEKGAVWYGKFGASPSEKVLKSLMSEKNPMILLIKNGGKEKYWAKIEAYTKTSPTQDVPDYYQNLGDRFGVWFKITDIFQAEDNVASRCIVASSMRPLSEVLHSMSPFFIADYEKSK